VVVSHASGPINKLTFTDPGVKVETPPLEINGLRIAGSCASGVCERQLGRDPKVASLCEKSAGSFLGSEFQDVDSWGPESPRILSPTSWKFLTHGMTSGHLLRQGPCHAATCGAKLEICNRLFYNKIHRWSPGFFVGQCLQRAGLTKPESNAGGGTRTTEGRYSG
jgi:hypothetical protein